MAANNNNSKDPSTTTTTTTMYLSKQIKIHQVAIAEINDKTTRAVYHKNGNIFFHTSKDIAIKSQQKQLDLARAKLEKLTSQ